MIERISIEPSRRCSKGCAFCYNGSSAEGEGDWTAGDVVALATDAAAHGVAAISFGGGEPLEWAPIFDALAALRGVIFRSMTTNGLELDACIDRLAAARPDKVHVSIHAPENPREVERVVRQVRALASFTKSGVNLLVRRSRLDEARDAARALRDAGIDGERVVYLPMRGPGAETPSPAEIARVAGTAAFQSMTCLAACGRSPRFASIAADRSVAWCSYTRSRRPLGSLDFASLVRALGGLEVEPCTSNLVKLGRRTIPD